MTRMSTVEKILLEGWNVEIDIQRGGIARRGNQETRWRNSFQALWRDIVSLKRKGR